MISVGLIGYGRAGSAVAHQLHEDTRFALRWIARRSPSAGSATIGDACIPFIGLDALDIAERLDDQPVDAIIDFSSPDAIYAYGEETKRRHIVLVSAISAYTDAHLEYARSLGEATQVLCSPNITLGINFLILAAKLLRGIAPFADVQILEQHFKQKAEVSGTARKIAQSLEVGDDKITSLRLGGIIGHHEVIFGFPYQTVRLVHDSIRREAFGSGAAFALSELAQCPPGFYTFEDLMMQKIKAELTRGVNSSESAERDQREG